MAIDTAEKRRSVSSLHLYPAGPGVTPAASPDQAWRQSAGYGYLGILAEAPEVAIGLITLTLPRRDALLTLEPREAILTLPPRDAILTLKTLDDD